MVRAAMQGKGQDMAIGRVLMDSGARLVVEAARDGDIEMARAYLGVSMVDALEEIDPDSDEAHHRVLVQCGYVLVCCFQEICDQSHFCEPEATVELAPGSGPERALEIAATMLRAYEAGDSLAFMRCLAATDEELDYQEATLAAIFGTVAAGAQAVTLETAFRLPSHVRS